MNNRNLDYNLTRICATPKNTINNKLNLQTDDKLIQLLLCLENYIVVHQKANTNNNKECNGFNTLNICIKNKTEITGSLILRFFHPKHRDAAVWQCLRDEIVQYNEISLALLQCCDAALNELDATKMLDKELEEVLVILADKLIELNYAPELNANELREHFMCTLAILNKIVHLCPLKMSARLPELYGIAKISMYCGLEMDNNLVQKIYASQFPKIESSSMPTQTINAKKMPKLRKPRSVQKTVMVEIQQDKRMSDSDASETEGAANNNEFKMERQCARVRLAALTLLGTLAQTQEQRTLFGYLHTLFPFPNSMQDTTKQHNLLNLALSDPHMRCRFAALQVALQHLLGFKKFLLQAEAPNPSGSHALAFISHAQNLGLMIMSTYDSLMNILSREKQALPVITQSLKCLAALVQSTPFERLGDCGGDIIKRLMTIVRECIVHKDVAIQIAALAVVENMVTVPKITKDIAAAIELEPLDLNESISNHANNDACELIEIENETESIETVNTAQRSTTRERNESKEKSVELHSWLLERILENSVNFHKSPQTAPLQIKCLQVLSALAVNFALDRYLAPLRHCVEIALDDSQADVRLAGARCLDSWAYNKGFHLTGNRKVLSNAQLEFWTHMLPTIITKLSAPSNVDTDTDKCHTVSQFKMTLCDVVSNIGVIAFEAQTHAMQTTLLSLLTGLGSGSDDVLVRAAAVRALAVFVLFPTLQTNLVLVDHVSELTLDLVKSVSLPVRIKVVWAMSNVSNALMSSEHQDSRERISTDLLYRLLTAAITCCSDNDKVRCNAVRTVGNLLFTLRTLHFQNEEYRDLFKYAVSKLVDCISGVGNAKVKWNTCYAIGNVLQNSFAFQAVLQYADFSQWHLNLYSTLCNVIVYHSNFKVRTNAALAIARIQQRSHFGNYFEKFWTALLEAVEQSNNLENFLEYNHRDHLQEQLCLTISKLLTLASDEDFTTLVVHLAQKKEVIRHTWLRVINRLVPEKCAELLLCAVQLRGRVRNYPQLLSDNCNAISFCAQYFAIE